LQSERGQPVLHRRGYAAIVVEEPNGNSQGIDGSDEEEDRGGQSSGTIGAVYKFVLDGDGGGTFIMNFTDNPGVTEADGAAQCIIKMAANDFVNVVEGRADMRLLFFTGKVKVEGDMGLAIKLKKLFDTIIRTI
jgi:putative sterol carrier protein